MSVRLGEILLKESLITQDQLEKALEFQRSNGGKLGSCLTKMGFITDDDITGVLSRQYGVPSINLKYYETDPNVIKLIPQDTALRYQVVPLSRVGSVLIVDLGVDVRSVGRRDEGGGRLVILFCPAAHLDLRQRLRWRERRRFLAAHIQRQEEAAKALKSVG